MVRKVSDAEAAVVRELQAQASLRRIGRKLERISDGDHTSYFDFLRGCRAQIVVQEVKDER